MTKINKMAILGHKGAIFGHFMAVALGYVTCNTFISKKHQFAPQYYKISPNGAIMKKMAAINAL